MKARYDSIGVNYAELRRPDPRIAGDAPRDEPSNRPVDLRPGPSAVADRLPSRARAVG